MLPLLPWVRWRSLLAGARTALAAGVWSRVPAADAGAFEPVAVPLAAAADRYSYLPAWLLTALAISAGLHRDRLSARACWSAALVTIGGYLGWAALPKSAGRQFAATALAAGLVALTIVVSYRRPRFVPAVLAAGTVAVLALQVAVIPGNFGQMPWNAPGNVPVQRACLPAVTSATRSRWRPRR